MSGATAAKTRLLAKTVRAATSAVAPPPSTLLPNPAVLAEPPVNDTIISR